MKCFCNFTNPKLVAISARGGYRRPATSQTKLHASRLSSRKKEAAEQHAAGSAVAPHFRRGCLVARCRNGLCASSEADTLHPPVDQGLDRSENPAPSEAAPPLSFLSFLCSLTRFFRSILGFEWAPGANFRASRGSGARVWDSSNVCSCDWRSRCLFSLARAFSLSPDSFCCRVTFVELGKKEGLPAT
jgi:hypothetical protein